MRNSIYKILLSSVIVISFGCAKRTDEAKPEAPPAQPAAPAPPAAQEPRNSGQGEGIVQKISKSRKFITLDHNDIPDIMDAMAMESPVQTPDLIKDIQVDDSV